LGRNFELGIALAEILVFRAIKSIIVYHNIAIIVCDDNDVKDAPHLSTHGSYYG